MSPNTPSSSAEWLVLVYRIPTMPTRLRAKVQRRLHRIGAVPLQRSAVTLPYSSDNSRALRIARHEIESMGGIAFLFQGTALGCHEQLAALVTSAQGANGSLGVEDFASEHRMPQRRAVAGR